MTNYVVAKPQQRSSTMNKKYFVIIILFSLFILFVSPVKAQDCEITVEGNCLTSEHLKILWSLGSGQAQETLDFLNGAGSLVINLNGFQFEIVGAGDEGKYTPQDNGPNLGTIIMGLTRENMLQISDQINRHLAITNFWTKYGISQKEINRIFSTARDLQPQIIIETETNFTPTPQPGIFQQLSSNNNCFYKDTDLGCVSYEEIAWAFVQAPQEHQEFIRKIQEKILKHGYGQIQVGLVTVTVANLNSFNTFVPLGPGSAQISTPNILDAMTIKHEGTHAIQYHFLIDILEERMSLKDAEELAYRSFLSSDTSLRAHVEAYPNWVTCQENPFNPVCTGWEKGWNGYLQYGSTIYLQWVNHINQRYVDLGLW
jgi:hypothetical protein